MSDRMFIDTNVLVYAFSTTGTDDREDTAWGLLEKAFRENSGVISTQVMKEFYVTMTSAIEQPISPSEARSLIEELDILQVVQVDVPLIYRATDLHRDQPLSFWDALVISCARRSDCDVLFSEDMNHGQTVDSVTIQNPFLDE